MVEGAVRPPNQVEHNLHWLSKPWLVCETSTQIQLAGIFLVFNAKLDV